MNNIIVLEQWKTEQEEIELVADQSNVAQRSISILTDIEEITTGVNLNPISLEQEEHGCPCGIARSKSHTVLHGDLRLTTRRSHLLDNWQEVVVRHENV